MSQYGMIRTLSVLGVVTLLVAGSAAGAKEGNTDAEGKTLTNMVARSLARKYNLQPPSNLPKQKMTKETMQTLRGHFREMSLINPKIMAMRMKLLGEKEPTPAQVQKMAEFIAPVFQEAVKLVIADTEMKLEKADDNNRGKLEENLEKLKQGTAATAKDLNRWKNGGFKPGEISSIEVPFLPKPMGGKYSPSSFAYWDQYVKMFIEAFQLDAGQQSMVHSVVNDLKTKAKAYRQDHKEEFAEIDKATKQLFKSTASNQEKEKKYAELQKKKEKLEKPIGDMFTDLSQRLMAIPTDDQRKNAQDVLGK